MNLNNKLPYKQLSIKSGWQRFYSSINEDLSLVSKYGFDAIYFYRQII